MNTEVPFNVFFARVNARAERKSEREKRRVLRGKNAWTVFNSGVEKYEGTFSSVLGQTFREYLHERKKNKGKVFVLDVMGTGGFLSHYPIDGEAAMTLVDHRVEEEKAHDKDIGKRIIPGNILRVKPWLDALSFIRNNDDTSMPGFDLITCRPRLGWVDVRGSMTAVTTNTDNIDWLIMNRMYSLLSPRGGTLVVETPEVDYAQWIKELGNTKGLEIKAYEEFHALRITKKEGAPSFLPRI